MRTIDKIACVLILAAGFQMQVKAGTGGATATTNASATIINPVSLGESDSDDAVAGFRSSVEVVKTNAGRSHNNTKPALSGIYNTATYCVSGIAHANYSISIPESITVSNNLDSLTIRNLTVQTGKEKKIMASSDTYVVLSDNGVSYFNLQGVVSATLSDVSGDYSGSFPISIDYQ